MIEVQNIIVGSINLAKIKDIDRFLQIINKYDGYYILKHNTFEVEAKSIMGIFSLNLEEDLTLIAKKAKAIDADNLNKALKEANLLKN